MGEQAEVKIPIRATADLAAAGQASAAIKDVGESAQSAAKKIGSANESAEALAKRFAEINARSDEWRSTLSKLSNDQMLEVEERLRAQIKAEGDLGRSTDELKKKLTDTYSQRTSNLDQSFAKTAEGARNAAHESESMAGKLKEVQGAARGTREVLEGLERGGLGGTVQAGRGFVEIFRTAAGVLGGLFIPVVLAAGGAILALRKHGEKLEEENKKAFEAQTIRSERIKAEYEQIAKTAEKTAEAQIKAIGKVIASYDEYLARLQKGDARLKESLNLQAENKSATIDRDEQLALAKAKTPEAKAKVTSDFALQRRKLSDDQANAEIIDSEQNARLRIEANNKQVVDLQRQRDGVAANLRDKSKEDEAARSDLHDLLDRRKKDGGDLAAPDILEAQDRAKKAAEALKDARKEDEKVRDQLKTASDKADEESADASAQLQNARTRGGTRIAQLQVDSEKRKSEAQPEIKRLTKEAGDAQNAQDFTAQDKAVRELNEVVKALANNIAENTRAARELTEAAVSQKQTLSTLPPRPSDKLEVTTPDDGSSKGPSIQFSGDVKKPLDQALSEARAKDVAFIDFAKTSVTDSKAAKKQIDLQQRQLANSR